MAVTYERRADIGLVRIDNPPVNALNREVRAGLVRELATALGDHEARAIVLYCGGRTFIAGADIAEFGTPLVHAAPSLPKVIERFEKSPKPVIAILHGTALGGGLELALGCNCRVGLATTRIGLPEVKLGILPGAGGTQRLPRLSGARAALDIITSGRFVDASEAHSLEILDAIHDGPTPLEAGMAFARRIVDEARPLQRVRDRCDKIEGAAYDRELFRQYRKRLAKRSRGQFSPLACVDAVEAAFTLPFEDGLIREFELYDECRNHPQHAALVYRFFSEREVARVPGLSDDAKSGKIERAAIIGAGTMGGGIAMCFADAGIPVKIVDRSRKALDSGVERVRENYRKSVDRGRLSNERARESLDLITPSLDTADIANADIVIEAVFEELDIKIGVFREVDAVAKPGAVLATNTSYLDVNRIAAATSRPADVLGMHFFSPANVMRLLEVVRADATSDETLKTAMSIGKTIGKIGVVSGVCDGFIGNRMYRIYQRQAFYMLEDGAFPHEIDDAVTEFGFAMGPLAVMDLTGHEPDYHTRRREDAARTSVERYVDLPDRLYEMGRLGQKTEAGWYRYGVDRRTPIPDPEIETLIVGESQRKGIERRTIPPDEIRMRALASLVNEGARILAEGIAARSIDIDAVWVNGYGFPAHEGGPMYWADTYGIARLVGDIERFGADDPHGWPLAPLLAELARTNGTFHEWSAARTLQ